MQLELAVAKCNKYATRESGDTVEVIESLAGGFVVLLADGQGSGAAAKILSQQAVSKAISLLKDGMPIAEVATNVHRHLYLYRGGKVSVTLTLIAVDGSGLHAEVSRNGDAPVVSFGAEGLRLLEGYAPPLGVGSAALPSVEGIELAPGSYLIAYSDGLPHAGNKSDHRLNLPPLIASFANGQPSAQDFADHLLRLAIERDRGFPDDDMTVAVLHLNADPLASGPLVRRMMVSVPIAS